MPSKKGSELEAQEPYGDLIPYADPSWYHSVRLLGNGCVSFADYEL